MAILAWQFKSVANDDSDKHTLFKCWEKRKDSMQIYLKHEHSMTCNFHKIPWRI